jgi:HAD superfamily hydrolase (TIGR01549 family)
MIGERMRYLTNIKAVLFDVDGTLIDIRGRYTRAINDALVFYDFKKMKKEKILELRRDGKNALEILMTQVGKNEKLNLIEEKRRQFAVAKVSRIDKPFKNSILTLKELKKKKKKIIIVSLREKRSVLVEQLKKFRMNKYIDGIFISNESPFGKDQDEMKKSLIQKILKRYGLKSKECVMVGDTLADIRGGKRCGLGAIGVTTGLAGKKLLQKEKAMVIDDISQLLEIVR